MVYEASFLQIGEHQIRLIFESEAPSDQTLLSGLQLINEHNGFIQTRREDYKHIYRRYDDDPLMIELCNDGIEYVEPEPPTEPEPYVPTEEELAEQERQYQIQALEAQISARKAELTSTDYKIIKAYEYFLVDKEIEYDMQVLHEERQILRDQINELEKDLEDLLAVNQE